MTMKSTLQALPVQTHNMLTVEQLKDACARSESVDLGNPKLEQTQFDLEAIFYPLGFPVLIATNSDEMLEAATESWSSFEQQFDIEPIRIHIGVTDGGSPVCPPTPVCRARDHLCTNIADAENYAVCDTLRSYAVVWASRAALEHRTYFRYFFLESTFACILATRYAWGIHAACVAIDGAGLLICGDSGAGKTTLAYACALAGATFVTDDGSYLVAGRDDRTVAGNCTLLRFRPESEQLFPELHGRDAMRRAEAGKPSVELAANRTLRTSPTARIRHVVFLNRHTGRQELTRFPVEAARLFMIQRLSGPLELRDYQVSMVDHLLAAGVYELHFTDLDWAVERLSQLAREGQ
jgi:hypothetical protein